jgi:hypothetical protein
LSSTTSKNHRRIDFSAVTFGNSANRSSTFASQDNTSAVGAAQLSPTRKRWLRKRKNVERRRCDTSLMRRTIVKSRYEFGPLLKRLCFLCVFSCGPAVNPPSRRAGHFLCCLRRDRPYLPKGIHDRPHAIAIKLILLEKFGSRLHRLLDNRIHVLQLKRQKLNSRNTGLPCTRTQLTLASCTCRHNARGTRSRTRSTKSSFSSGQRTRLRIIKTER